VGLAAVRRKRDEHRPAGCLDGGRLAQISG